MTNQNPTKPAGDNTVTRNTGESNGVEGEGSYTATRKYNEGLKKSIEAGTSDRLAQEAKDALDGPEGDELREAERAAKERGAKAGTVKS